MRLSTTIWRPATGDRRAVLLHGITGSSASWWRVAEHLAASGCMVEAPDLRGHGNSPRPTGACSLDDLVEDVASTVGRETDLLIGHSFGGTLALRGVATGALRARTTVLEDPVLTLLPDQAAAVVEPEIAEEPGDLAAMRREQPLWLDRDLIGRALAHHQMDPAAVRRAWTANTPWDLTALVATASTTTKLRVVLPSPSPYLDARLVALLVDRLGRDAVLEVPGSGHSVHREAYETFVAALDHWRPSPPW